MRVRQLSPTGDYTFGHGQKNFFIDEPAGVGQVVSTSLQLWLGEFVWDLTQGTPYIQGVLGKHSKAEADATIQSRILEAEGVTDIVVGSYSSTVNSETRAMSIAVRVNTIFGPTQIQIANFLNF